MAKKFILSRKASPFVWMLISVILITVVSVNAFISRANLHEFDALHDSIRNSGDILVAIEDLHISMLNLDREVAQNFVLQNYSDIDLLNIKYLSLLEKIERLSTMQSIDPAQQALIESAISEVRKYGDKVEELIAAMQQSPRSVWAGMTQTLIDDENYKNLNVIFNQLTANEEKIRNDNIVQLSHTIDNSAQTQWISFAVSFIATLIILLLARYLFKEQLEQKRKIEQQNDLLAKAVEERTQELSIYSQELARSNRELEDFAFVASHDLQEPLRKIGAFGERLVSQCGDNLDDRGKDYLSRMLNAAQRMSKLISDLLAFSRVNTQGKPFEEVDLAEIVEDILEDLSEAISDAKAKVYVESLPKVNADPMQMRQLFYNLINNAVKFSGRSEQPRVEISVEEAPHPEQLPDIPFDKWQKISVKDNGIGFEQKYAEKIFAPFQRLHGKQEFSGTGIGLSICRRIVERHNGVIVAESEKGKGASFKVTLPVDNTELTIVQQDK